MASHDQEVLFPNKEKWVCLTFVGGSSHSDESKRRGSISRRILYFKQYVRVASGVETDWQKPGYQSATEDNEIAPLHITTMFLSVKG